VLTAGSERNPTTGRVPSSFGKSWLGFKEEGGTRPFVFHGGNRAGGALRRARKPLPSYAFILQSLSILQLDTPDVFRIRSISKFDQAVGVRRGLREDVLLQHVAAEGTRKPLRGFARNLRAPVRFIRK
jgi:hypothetical protein